MVRMTWLTRDLDASLHLEAEQGDGHKDKKIGLRITDILLKLCVRVSIRVEERTVADGAKSLM